MNYLKTMLLLTALTVLFIWIGKMIGGQTGMVIALVLAVLVNGMSFWFSDKLVLTMYRARPIDAHEAPELYGVVSDLIRAANMPMPKLYIIEDTMPNAFATGRDPQHAAVAVTTGLLGILNQREVRGVLAHELAHVKNRDILIATIAAVMAGAVMMLANLAQMAAWFGIGRSSEDDEGGGTSIIGLLLAIIVAPLAATIIQMAISRGREYQADASGARISGDPLALASALQQLARRAAMTPSDIQPSTAHLFIVNPLHGGGLLSLFSTHPPIPERVKRLEAMAE
ncbi:MAG TPA: zinc metalloprotease HtpX [Armatimonadota bacterium]|nr:zinc metalloprotease HtpX [Armatimonadota bacterium]